MGLLAWLAGTAAIVALRYWEIPAFWLGVVVAGAVGLVLGGALGLSRYRGVAGVPIFLALTGASAATAAVLHDLDKPWDGYLDITAIVLVAGFAVTVVVASTFGIAVTAGEEGDPLLAMWLSLIPGVLGLVSLIVDAIVDFPVTIDACVSVGTVLLLSSAVVGLLSSATALISGEEARDVAPLATSFGFGGVGVIAAAEVTRSEFAPLPGWALVPLLVAIGLGVLLVAVCVLFAVGVIVGGTLLFAIDVVRDNWAPVAGLGVVTLILDLAVPLPDRWEGWDSLVPALLLPAGVLGFAAVVFLGALEVSAPDPAEATPVSVALAGSIAGGTLATATLTAAIAFDPPVWGTVLLVLATVAGLLGCVGSAGYAVAAPRPAPALAMAAPVDEPVTADDGPEPAEHVDYDELLQSLLVTAKAPVQDMPQAAVHEPGFAAGRQPTIGRQQLEGFAGRFRQNWRTKMSLSEQLNLIMSFVMMLLTMVGLLLTIILAVAT